MDEKAILQKFYVEMYGTVKGREVLEQFKADIKKIKSQRDVIEVYKKYEVYLTFGRSLGTIKNVFNDFKKAINSADKIKHKELLLQAFSLPSGYYYAVNEKSAKVVEERKERGSTLEMSVKEFKDLINECFKNGMDKNITFWQKPLGSRQTKENIRAYYLATYLALVTGRRLTEILKTMELKKYKESIKIKGILKKKNDDKEGVENFVDLLILDNAAENVVKAWRELRKIFNCTNLSNRECNNKYNNIFNRFLKTNILSNATFHDIRALYAELAWQKYKDKADELDVGKRDFIENVLLHRTDIRAVDFYLNRASVKK